MRNGTNPRKNRGRSNNVRRNNPSGSSNYRPQTVFESNGPEGRIRGNAQQIYEKYIALATDAAMSDDKVRSESFYQHAEHYLRLMLHDTDIDYDIYRQEQQTRRENRLNGIVDDDTTDNDVEDSMDMDDVGDFGTQAQPESMRDHRPTRRPPPPRKQPDDRMIDPPGFLSASTPQKKEIKIESAQKELAAELA